MFDLFTEKIRSHHAARAFSSTASELLTIAPIILRYFKEIVIHRGRLIPHCQSLIACLRVVLLLLACRLSVVTPAVLANAIKQHMDLFKLAYGNDAVRPKHQFALHLPSMLQHHGCLLTTFVNERKHRVVKQYTAPRATLLGWEYCCLEEVCSHQLYELEQPFFLSMQTSTPIKRLKLAFSEIFPGVEPEHFTSHTGLKLHGGTAQRGDVVSYEDGGDMKVGMLHACVGIARAGEHSLWAIGSAWEFASKSADQSIQPYKATDEAYAVEAQKLDCIFPYSMASDRGECSVYVPFELRDESCRQ